MRKIFSVLSVALALCGCITAYKWTPSVPERMRTVAVPTFRNDTDVTELGDVVTRQILREVQREGTFKIRRVDDAALEVQGTVTKAESAYGAGDRRSGARLGEYRFTVLATVSVIDRANGRVLIDNRPYRAATTFVVNQDRQTGERNASGRVAEDLARQIVDDLTTMEL